MLEPTEINEALKDADATPQFTVLEASAEERQRWRASFSAGSLIQVLLALVFLWFLTLPPVPREPKGINHLQVVRITFPPRTPVQHPRIRRVPLHLPPRPLKQLAKLPPVRSPIRPKVVPRHVAPPVMAKVRPKLPLLPPKPKLARSRFEAFEAPKTPPKRKLQVHVGAFGGHPKMAMLKLPRRKVQTGGFGDPNGLPGEAENHARPNVAHLGSFDAPEGPGEGNGTGGMHGARGLIASAGFGNGIAGADAGSANDAAGNGPVRSAGFASAGTMTHARAQQNSRPQVAAYVPVEITGKPNPVYTAEAQKHHIQGDVLLRVDFMASGRLRVLSVERGLGYGLNQAAIRAAEQIRFKPARRNGQPVDITATLHIVFQLAD